MCVAGAVSESSSPGLPLERVREAGLGADCSWHYARCVECPQPGCDLDSSVPMQQLRDFKEVTGLCHCRLCHVVGNCHTGAATPAWLRAGLAYLIWCW